MELAELAGAGVGGLGEAEGEGSCSCSRIAAIIFYAIYYAFLLPVIYTGARAHVIIAPLGGQL